MKVNYHTHTYRCHHARGSEWEYVEKAIEVGFKTLGFSDHSPYPFPDGYRSRVRMLPEKLAHYIGTVEKMRELYGDRIEILCGLETEYYPDLFPAYLEMLRELKPDAVFINTSWETHAVMAVACMVNAACVVCMRRMSVHRKENC